MLHGTIFNDVFSRNGLTNQQFFGLTYLHCESSLKLFRVISALGAVYMSPVCRDETLAGLKIKKRNLGGNMLTRIGLIRTSNSCFIQQIFNKNNIILNIAVTDNILCRRIFVFTSFFVLNKVSMLTRLAGLMHHMDKFNPG